MFSVFHGFRGHKSHEQDGEKLGDTEDPHAIPASGDPAMAFAPFGLPDASPGQTAAIATTMQRMHYASAEKMRARNAQILAENRAATRLVRYGSIEGSIEIEGALRDFAHDLVRKV